MSHSVPLAKSSLGHRALVLVTLPLLLGLVGTHVAYGQNNAQQPETERSGRPGRHMLASTALEGPPAPSFMRDTIHVSGKSLQEYTKRYESHMAATKAARDSLRSSLQAARAAFEKGDRSEARSRHDALREQWKQLATEDKKFEDGLKSVLTKDEQTRYLQWKDQRKQEAREQWRHRRRGDR